MEEDVLNALQTRTAYLPGSFDRDGKIIFIVNIINDLQSWQRKCLELSINYLKRSLSAIILQKGVTVIVDAQKTTARINRQHARFIYNLFEGLTVKLFLVKSEGFWEKHVETCTKSQTKEEPIVLSRARLMKYFDLHSLPDELGGCLQYNYDLWLQQRKSIDEFVKFHDNCLSAMESLQKLLHSHNKSIRATEADVELKKNSQMHATVQCSIETVIEMGNRILTRFNEVYAPTPPVGSNLTATKSNATTTLTMNDHDVHTPVASTNGLIMMKHTLPPDLNCERSRIELRLNEIEKRQTDLRTAWLELIQTVREARELATLEEGVAFVTNWILNTAEQMLNRQTAIGCDIRACENLRSAHDNLELECRETYGFFAELLYKIESYAGSKETNVYRDLLSQKEFMQFVCRSFATRLERRRNILITSLRFYRLVTEYFEKTTEVFETLVMGGSGNKMMEDLIQAKGTLQKLKSCQQSLASIERELIKEGEKLSDMLSMPVKDALGRDLHIDYSDDICSVREILDTTLARRKIFSNSVELQKLTLEQVTHIYTYEQDACMAIKWLDDLYNVMIKCHSHVGCNIHEIQVQKDELQTFQETGKSIFNYGCQLLQASQTLRGTCKLEVTVALKMQQQLEKTWHSLQAISQEHMTRLRVSAVFHRSVEDYCQQLIELRKSLRLMLQQQQVQLRQQQRSSSSGISSESESQVQQLLQTTTVTRTQTQCNQPQPQQQQMSHSTIIHIMAEEGTTSSPEKSPNEQRELLRKYLIEREKLLVEVGRMVRLGRLLKTRLKEPFVLDAATGKRNKNETEVNAETSSCAFYDEPVNAKSMLNENANVEPLKLEGLNLLKSLVENEQNVLKGEAEFSTSLSEEVADLLKKRLSQDRENTTTSGLINGNKHIQQSSLNYSYPKDITLSEDLLDLKENPQGNNSPISDNRNITESSKSFIQSDKESVPQQISNLELIGDALERNKMKNEILDAKTENRSDTEIVKQKSISDMLKTNENTSIAFESNDCLDSLNSLSQSSITENFKKTILQSSFSSPLENNDFPINSSIVVEDIPTEIQATPSPTVDSTISGSSSSNTSILESSAVHDIVDPSKIIVKPIDNNGLACSAITTKLTDIAEVAESLDAVIREVQENVQTVELESNPSPSDKKLGTLRSTSSEDWHSRSTEDDSFATASEGNFTPHSHSSASFQTASGRTSSFRSCDKNSFDASEADDSTFAFEMPEKASPLNMSFESSEQSYLSAQPPNSESTYEDKERTPTKLSDCSSQTVHPFEEDHSSIADIEDLHSESVTPTPAETTEEYNSESIPIESETELEIAGISDAPPMEILTEHSAMPMSRTPEVSPNLQMNLNDAARELQNTNNNNNNNKPNAAWRRSKYYENITKQTIKGFL